GRAPTVVVVTPPPPAQNTPVSNTPVANAPGSPVLALAELTSQERYDLALWDALTLVADRKLSDALATLERARTLQDTDHVPRGITRLKLRIDPQAAAEHTALDIQTVLADGKADQAARLAVTALSEYGGSEAAENLARLKRQADAL